jgi:hypothetical protein
MEPKREPTGVTMLKESPPLAEPVFGRRHAVPDEPAQALRPAPAEPIDRDSLRRLHYAAAVACGVFAALVVHIVLTVFGLGLDGVLHDGGASLTLQTISALAWWAIAAAAFVCGWAAGAYLIAAARERALVYRVAQRALIAVVFGVATTGGIMSKSDGFGSATEVAAGLAALGLGLICAYCGARVAFLNAEQL